MKKMLLVFAHPDDESFTCGGTVAKYVKAGWDVDLICATRGQAGESGPYTGVSGEDLGIIRQKELETAATLLGISTITFFDYMDGSLIEELPGELEDQIYRKMEELVPDCVITFDTSGISNHPDHIRVCYATTFAFQKYALWIAQRLKGTEDFNEELEPKLYYTCVPESTVVYLQKMKVFPKESFDKPWVGIPDKLITTVVRFPGSEMLKKKALLSHKTQEKDVQSFLSLPNNPMRKQEYFVWRFHGTREVFMGKHDRISPSL